MENAKDVLKRVKSVENEILHEMPEELRGADAGIVFGIEREAGYTDITVASAKFCPDEAARHTQSGNPFVQLLFTDAFADRFMEDALSFARENGATGLALRTFTTSGTGEKRITMTVRKGDQSIVVVDATDRDCPTLMDNNALKSGMNVAIAGRFYLLEVEEDGSKWVKYQLDSIAYFTAGGVVDRGISEIEKLLGFKVRRNTKSVVKPSASVNQPLPNDDDLPF